MRPSKSILVKVALAASGFLFAPASNALAADAPLFQFEQQAKLHCPDDIVVWVNLSTKIYTLQGERWYGSTKHGSFVCRTEGEQAGYKPSHEPEKEDLLSPIKWVQWLSGG